MIQGWSCLLILNNDFGLSNFYHRVLISELWLLENKLFCFLRKNGNNSIILASFLSSSMKFQPCIINSSQVCFPYFYVECFYVKRRFMIKVHNDSKISPFCLSSPFRSSPFLGSIWSLALANHCKLWGAFFPFCRLTPRPPPWIWVFVFSHCVQTFVAELFLTTFVLFQQRFLSNHNNVAQVEWKVSILQWCHTGRDYLHTSICEGSFISRNLSIAQCHNIS